MTRYFLVVPKSELKRYPYKVDRDAFSKPVEVFPVFTHVTTRILYVDCPDHHRGPCRFPVDEKYLKTERRLTQEQKELIK